MTADSSDTTSKVNLEGFTPIGLSENLGIGLRIQAVMQDLKAVGKDSESKGKGFTFKFRGIDAVVNEIKPLFAKHGISVTKEILKEDYQNVVFGSDGKAAVQVRVHIRYKYTSAHDSLDFRLDEVIAEAMDQGDKSTAKVMSVALRTSLLQVLLIPTGEPDPDEDNYERGGNTQQQTHERVIPPLPADLVKLIEDATTPEELGAIRSRIVADETINADVKYGLGLEFKKRIEQFNSGIVKNVVAENQIASSEVAVQTTLGE